MLICLDRRWYSLDVDSYECNDGFGFGLHMNSKSMP